MQDISNGLYEGSCADQKILHIVFLVVDGARRVGCRRKWDWDDFGDVRRCGRGQKWEIAKKVMLGRRWGIFLIFCARRTFENGAVCTARG